MGGYSHKTWTCPFYKKDEKKALSCEAGKLTFPDRKTANKYMNRYCAGGNGWKQCSFAAALIEHYDEVEK